MSEVPESWAEVALGKMFDPGRGRTVIPSRQPETRFELYSVPSFAEGSPERLAGDEIGSSKQAVVPGTVLACRINPRINRVWLVRPATGDPQIASSEWFALPPVEGLLPRYVRYALQAPEVRAFLTSNVSGVGGSLMRVRVAAFWRTPLVLAPTREQHRIVARIEALFSELDDGVTALKRAEANLERYRASVLKAAVEGRLTEQWRSDNPPNQTGEELLRRILGERRKRWEEAQLAAFAAKGRQPPRNWKSRYREPLAPDTSDLPALPEGWCWATVDQVGQVIGGLTKNQARAELPASYPYLRVANVYADELRLEDVKTIGVSESELERVLLRAGDLMVVEGNGSPSQIGRVAEWNGELTTCCHQNHLIKVRCDRGRACLPRWLLSWLLSPIGRRTVLDKASSTSGLYTLSLSKVRALPLPLAPYREQVEAVKLADLLRETGRLARRRVQAGIDVQSAALRQSILKRAFEGRLVPQDPDDEPAAVLLERIRAAREA
ncbi:MAG: hypothetical protein OXI49_18645 [Acidobacteriota bacterium]|nr:hypothetical protein [Acidobacteriota bacterium]